MSTPAGARSAQDDVKGLARLVANVGASFMGQFSTAVVGLLLTPILVRQLGNELYGLWILAGSILGVAGVLELGVSSAVVKYVAQYEAWEDHQASREAVSTALAIHLVLGVLAAVVVALLGTLGLERLGIHPASIPDARLTLMIVAFTLGLSFPLDLLGALLLGYQRYDLANLVNVGSTLAAAMASAAVVWLGGGLVGLAVVNLVASTAGNLLKLALARSIAPHLYLSARLVRRSRLHEIFRFSLWLFLFKLAIRSFYHADAILIGFFLSATAITPYNIGMKLAGFIGFLSGPMVSVFFPLSSSLHSRYDEAGLHKLLIQGTRFALALTVPGSLFLFIFGQAVIERWIGPGQEASGPILAIFLLIFLVGAAQNTPATILRGIGRPKVLTISVVLEYAANLALSIVLIPLVGIIGAALGTLLPLLVNDLGVIPWIACRSVHLSPWRFAREALAPPCIPVLPVLAVLWLAAAHVGTPSVPVLLATAALTFLLYAALYLLAVGPQERLHYRQQVTRLLLHWRASTGIAQLPLNADR
jgi:O-antigen/teichoic acid export membrane protein